MSFLSGIDYSINIGSQEYFYYYDTISVQNKTTKQNLIDIEHKLKRRVLYNERTIYYDNDDGGARKNIFFIENINVVSCNIYTVTHLFENLILDINSNVKDDDTYSTQNIQNTRNTNNKFYGSDNEEIISIIIPDEFINEGILESGTTLHNIDKYSHYFWVKRPFEGLVFFYITIKQIVHDTTEQFTVYLKYNGNLLNTLDLVLISPSVVDQFLLSFRQNVRLELLDHASYLNINASRDQLSLNSYITKWTDIIKLHNTPKQNCVFGNVLYNNLIGGDFDQSIVPGNSMKKYRYIEDVDTHKLQFKYMDSSSNPLARKYVRIFNIDGVKDPSFNISDIDNTVDNTVDYVSFWFGNQDSNLDIYIDGSYCITVKMEDKILGEDGNRIYMRFTDTSIENSGTNESIVLPDTMVVSINGVYFNVHPFYGPIDPANVTNMDVYLYPEYESNLLHVFNVKKNEGLEIVDILFESSKIQLKMDILEIKDLQNKNIIYEKIELIENLRYFELFSIDILLNYYQYAINEINNHYVQLVQYNLNKLEYNPNYTIKDEDLKFTNKISKISDDLHLYIHFDKYDLSDLFDEKNETDGIIEIVMLYSSVTFNINDIQYICFQDTELNSNGLPQKVLLKRVKKGSKTTTPKTMDKYLINEIATKKYYSTIQFMKEHHFKEMISFKFRNFVFVYKFPFIMNENNEKEEQDNLQVEYNKVLYIKYDDPDLKTNPKMQQTDKEIITPQLSNTIYFHVRGNLKIEQINDPVIMVSTDTDIYDRIYGNNHIVEIQNKDTHIYNGFFKCNGLDASANIKIDNLHVEVGSKYMSQGEGLIVAKNSSFMKMIGCSSYSPYIQKYGGGLVGSDSSNCVVEYSYSNAKIHQGGGGIFGRGAESSRVFGCYSMGEIIMGGGIFGNDASNCFVSKSYTTGQIHAASGGIFGNYVRDSSANDAFSTSEQIYPLSGSVFGNYAVRCKSIRGTIPLDGSKNLVDDNKYHTLKFDTDTSVPPESMTSVKQFGAFSKDCTVVNLSYSAFKDETYNNPDDKDEQCKVCLYHVFKNATHYNTDDNDKGDGYEYKIWYVPDTFHISSHIQHRGTFLKNTLRNYRLHSFPFADPILHTEILELVKTNNLRTDTVHGKQLILYENIDITNTSFKYTGLDNTIHEEEQRNASFESIDTDVYIACFLNVRYDNLSFVLPDGYIVVGDSGSASILRMGGNPEHIRKYIQPIILSIIQVNQTRRQMSLRSSIDIIDKNTFETGKYEEAYKYLNKSGNQRIENTRKLYKNGRLQLYLNDCYFTFNPYFYKFDGQSFIINYTGIENVDGLFSNNFNYNDTTLHEMPHIKNIKLINGKTKVGGGFLVRSSSKYIKVSECTTSGEINDEAGGIFGKSCEHCVIMNSYTSGKIGYGGGGIYGSESVNCTAETCYTSGEIVQGGGGITGMESKGSYLTMCFTNGIIGPFSGGLIGSYASSPYTIDRCYTTGDISYASGGFIGAYTDYEKFDQYVNNGDGNDDVKDYTGIDESIISYSYVSGKLYEYSSYFYGAGSFYNLNNTFKYVYKTENLSENANNDYTDSLFASANTHVYNTIQSFFLDENIENENNNSYGNDSFKPPDEPEMDSTLYDNLLDKFSKNGFIKDTYGIQSYALLKSFYDNVITFNNELIKAWSNYYHYTDNPTLFYEFILNNNDVNIFAPILLNALLYSESFSENKFEYTVKLPNYYTSDQESRFRSRTYSLEKLKDPNINNPSSDLWIDYTNETKLQKYYLTEKHEIHLDYYDRKNSNVNIVYKNNRSPYHFVYPAWIYEHIFKDNVIDINETEPITNQKNIYAIKFDVNNVVLDLKVSGIFGYNNENIFTSDFNKDRYSIAVFYDNKCIFYLPVYKNNDFVIRIKHDTKIKLNDNKLQFLLYDYSTYQLIPIYISSIKRNFKNKGLSLKDKIKFLKSGWNQLIYLDKTDEKYKETQDKVDNLKSFPEYFQTNEYDISFKIYNKYIYSHDEQEEYTSLTRLEYNQNYHKKNVFGKLVHEYRKYYVNDIRLYYTKEEISIFDIRNNFINKESYLGNDVLINTRALLDSDSEKAKYELELKNDFIKYE